MTWIRVDAEESSHLFCSYLLLCISEY